MTRDGNDRTFIWKWVIHCPVGLREVEITPFSWPFETRGPLKRGATCCCECLEVPTGFEMVALTKYMIWDNSSEGGFAGITRNNEWGLSWFISNKVGMFPTNIIWDWLMKLCLVFSHWWMRMGMWPVKGRCNWLAALKAGCSFPSLDEMNSPQRSRYVWQVWNHGHDAWLVYIFGPSKTEGPQKQKIKNKRHCSPKS